MALPLPPAAAITTRRSPNIPGQSPASHTKSAPPVADGNSGLGVVRDLDLLKRTQPLLRRLRCHIPRVRELPVARPQWGADASPVSVAVVLPLPRYVRESLSYPTFPISPHFVWATSVGRRTSLCRLVHGLATFRAHELVRPEWHPNANSIERPSYTAALCKIILDFPTFLAPHNSSCLLLLSVEESRRGRCHIKNGRYEVVSGTPGPAGQKSWRAAARHRTPHLRQHSALLGCHPPL